MVNEAEVVRSFCRFVRLKAAATPQPHGTWRPTSDHDVASLVVEAVSASPESLQSMIEAGRTIEKMQRGMSAAAIATPAGPVLVETDHGVGLGCHGSGIRVNGPAATPVQIHGISWPDAAVALHDALVAAGGPVKPLLMGADVDPQT
jgi:hypothetical protein